MGWFNLDMNQSVVNINQIATCKQLQWSGLKWAPQCGFLAQSRVIYDIVPSKWIIHKILNSCFCIVGTSAEISWQLERLIARVEHKAFYFSGFCDRLDHFTTATGAGNHATNGSIDGAIEIEIEWWYQQLGNPHSMNDSIWEMAPHRWLPQSSS